MCEIKKRGRGFICENNAFYIECDSHLFLANQGGPREANLLFYSFGAACYEFTLQRSARMSLLISIPWPSLEHVYCLLHPAQDSAGLTTSASILQSVESVFDRELLSYCMMC